jgi:hypothetical protein
MSLAATASSYSLSDLFCKLRYVPYVFRHAVALSVEALCYEQEGRGFEFLRGHWIFFNWRNPSSRTIALGLTQLITETSIGKARPALKADNLTAIYGPIV